MTAGRLHAIGLASSFLLIGSAIGWFSDWGLYLANGDYKAPIPLWIQVVASAVASMAFTGLLWCLALIALRVAANRGRKKG